MTRRPTTGLRALLAAFVVLLCALPLVGERVSSWDDLVGQVAARRVTQVTVHDAMRPGDHGTQTATVHWRDGWVRRITTVRQVVKDPHPSASGIPDEGTTTAAPDVDLPTAVPGDDTPTIDTSVLTALAAANPAVRVTEANGPRSWSNVLGWQTPGWVGLALFAWWAFGIGAFLTSRDEPPLATRWGWGWWLLSPASGPALALWMVLMVRAEATGRPAWQRGRLTGGWSFLLAILFSGAVASWFGLA